MTVSAVQKNVEKNYFVRGYVVRTTFIIFPVPEQIFKKGDTVYVYKINDKLIVSKVELDVDAEVSFKRKVQQNNYKSRYIYLPESLLDFATKNLKCSVYEDYAVYERVD